jgi:hypothetical protein
MEQELKLTAKELRRALLEIKNAEKGGFMYCEAVFELSNGENDHWLTGRYIDLIEKAHPSNGKLDWGRGQEISKRYIFKDGELIRSPNEQKRIDEYPASEAICSGKINGYKYWITNSKYGGLNGYVSFSKQPTIENGYSGILTYVPVHGGITYAEKKEAGMIYGFDTAHCDSEKYPRNDKKWIKKQIKKMIDGIKMASKIEKKYLAAKTNKEKAKYAQMVLDTDQEKENQYNLGIGINILSNKF